MIAKEDSEEVSGLQQDCTGLSWLRLLFVVAQHCFRDLVMICQTILDAFYFLCCLVVVGRIGCYCDAE